MLMATNDAGTLTNSGAPRATGKTLSMKPAFRYMSNAPDMDR
jgi:hypothetical protein